jgi:iron complex transport system substrate-binding protein
MELDEITASVVDAALGIHRGLGPGLLESVYEVTLAATLARRGFRVERQLPISFCFEGIEFEQVFRLDLLVEQRVVVEVKSVEHLARVHPKQVLTYLRLMNLRVGLLLNFGAGTMKEGIKRVVNDLAPSDSPALRVNRPR